MASTTTTGTGNGNTTVITHPSEWTPRTALGFALAASALGMLCFLAWHTDDPALRGQIVITLSNVAVAGATYFLGNMQARAATVSDSGTGPTTNVDANTANIQNAPPAARPTPTIVPPLATRPGDRE